MKVKEQKKMGRPEIPWQSRRLQTIVSISPFHRYVLARLQQDGTLPPTRQNGGISDAIAQAIEILGEQQGVTEEQFLKEKNPEQYIRGTKT